MGVAYLKFLEKTFAVGYKIVKFINFLPLRFPAIILFMVRNRVIRTTHVQRSCTPTCFGALSCLVLILHVHWLFVYTIHTFLSWPTAIYYVGTEIMLMLSLSKPCASTTRYCCENKILELAQFGFIVL